jgi:protein O-mannosyl-transferase
MNHSRRFPILPVAGALVLVLLLTWLVYRPGLSGGFLFDDFVNMPVLGYYGRIDNWTAFWLYLTSGSADPTGRPLAMLSFLIDANQWPADPYPFKRTSLLLHLLNGVLLAWLLTKLGRATGRRDATVAAAAVLGAALWLLHPLLISTTLYIVQRETMLAATFVLLGLLFYACSRELAERGQIKGVWLSALSICACTLLAVLSKANGVLLPLLALVVESVLLAPARPVDHPGTKRAFLRMRRWVLVLPSLLLGIYLAWKAINGFVSGMPAIRPWTLGERLLTEARMLMEYLSLLWLPRAYNHGLFNDDVVVSTSLVSPLATLFCVLAIVALLTAAWHWRKRYPALALAVLFFFAGHLLESTVVPLELYFEHRNYLPAALMFWPLALWICGNSEGSDPAAPRKSAFRMLRPALAIVLPLVLAALTYLGAGLWGNAQDQALLWAAQNPKSPRAQVTAAQFERARGESAAAISRLQRALQDKPYEIQLVLNMIGAKCQAGTLTDADIEHAAIALRMTPTPGRVGGDWFLHSLTVATDSSCPLLTLDVVDRLLRASAENPHSSKIDGPFLQDRLNLQGRIALLRGEDERALALFNTALDADPRPDAALQQAAILGSANRPRLALRHLDHLAQTVHTPAGPGWTMPSLHAWLLWKSGYWDNEISHLRKTLNEDVAAALAPEANNAIKGSPSK